MNKLPLNIIFSITPEDIKSEKYVILIKDYQDKLGNLDIFYGLFAHVKVSKETKALLPDVIDYLYHNDIRPIVSETKPTDGLFVDIVKCTDLYQSLAEPQLHVAPYTILANSKYTITSTTRDLSTFLHAAVSILSANKEVLTVGFLPHVSLIHRKPMNETCDYADVFMLDYPAIFRTRDMWLASYFSMPAFNNQSSSNKFDSVLSNVLKNFGPNPVKFLYFNPSLALLTTL